MKRRIRSITLVLPLSLVFAVPAHAQSATPSSEPDRSTSDFSVPIPDPSSDRPLIPSFQKRSGTRAGGPANELNTGDQRARRDLPGGDVAGAISGATLYHGNFCGYGNRGADRTPTDELDAACKRHDECFDRTNRSCGCNEWLRQDAYRVSELKQAPRELRSRAATVLEAIDAMDCND